MTVATPQVKYSLKSLKWPKMTAKFVDMRSLLNDTYCSDAVVPPRCPSTLTAAPQERRGSTARARAHSRDFTAAYIIYNVHVSWLPSHNVMLATLMIERCLRWMSEIMFTKFGHGTFHEYGGLGLCTYFYSS